MPASIRDVAQLAGVSVGTVSNVLNRPGDVAKATTARVHGAIEQLQYVRNEAARGLRAGVTQTVGFIVLDGENPFYNAVVRGAEDEATSQGIVILHGSSDEDANRQSTYLDLFEEQRVRGVLLSPTGDVTRRLLRLRERGIAAVLVDRFSGDGQFSSVSVDGIVGGRMAVDHLLDLGHRRIGFVGGPFNIRQMIDRLAGARAACDNVDYPTNLVVLPTAGSTVTEGIRVAKQIVKLAPRERPEALFAGSDVIALGLLQGLRTAERFLVPDDIALIGFDDIPFAAAAAVPLSSIRQPSRTIGRTALRTLLEESGDPQLEPRQTVFPPQLVARQSTLG